MWRKKIRGGQEEREGRRGGSCLYMNIKGENKADWAHGKMIDVGRRRGKRKEGERVRMGGGGREGEGEREREAERERERERERKR